MRLIILSVLLLPFFSHSVFAADPITRIQQFVLKDISKASDQDLRNIVSMSANLLIAVDSQKSSRQNPELIKLAGAAYGQISYGSPFTLQFFDQTIIPFLRSGQLTYRDLDTPYFNYVFGQQHARDYLGLDVFKELKNGQFISDRYFWNYPLYFNRLLGEYSGEYLLIGGGDICECGNPGVHPKELFYRGDIDNSHKPDVVLHAGYLEHLMLFPTNRFSFIWFEHCTVAELVQDKVLSQYFRFTKPGAVFLMQMNFIIPKLEATHKKFADDLKEKFLAKKFAVLEFKTATTLRNSRPEEFYQIILMKPFLKNSNQEKDPSPTMTINLDDYREPTPEEQVAGLTLAKSLSQQLCGSEKRLEHSKSR